MILKDLTKVTAYMSLSCSEMNPFVHELTTMCLSVTGEDSSNEANVKDTE